MHLQIDKSYRTEPLRAWELKSLTQKFNDFSLYKKSDWQVLGLLLLGTSVLALILPFIPSRLGRNNWTPPTTLEEYHSRFTIISVIAPVLALVVSGYTAIRNKIDLRSGIKRTGNFRVAEVIQFGPVKILVLNGWHLFTIKEKEDYFNSVNEGHIITIKRTSTYRLIDYYVRDEEVFANEQKKAYQKIPKRLLG